MNVLVLERALVVYLLIKWYLDFVSKVLLICICVKLPGPKSMTSPVLFSLNHLISNKFVDILVFLQCTPTVSKYSLSIIIMCNKDHILVLKWMVVVPHTEMYIYLLKRHCSAFTCKCSNSTHLNNSQPWDRLMLKIQGLEHDGTSLWCPVCSCIVL